MTSVFCVREFFSPSPPKPPSALASYQARLVLVPSPRTKQREKKTLPFFLLPCCASSVKRKEKKRGPSCFFFFSFSNKAPATKAPKPATSK